MEETRVGFVLDCSVTMAWCFDDEATPETDRIRDWNDSYARQENVGVEEIRARTLATIPLRRYGTPEGYARLAAFLLSEENDYVSGQQILYDGGLVVAN